MESSVQTEKVIVALWQSKGGEVLRTGTSTWLSLSHVVLESGWPGSKTRNLIQGRRGSHSSDQLEQKVDFEQMRTLARQMPTWSSFCVG